MKKYSVGELTIIAFRVKCIEQLQQLEDILYYLIAEWPNEYNKHQLGAVFTVMNGKKAVL